MTEPLADVNEISYSKRMTGFTKLFSTIVHSTVWREEMHVKVVWVTMLALADRNGVVPCSLPGLADAARVTIDQCKDALTILMGPDEWSRTKDYEGRRVVECDGGWAILNYLKYRELASADERRIYVREAVARHRSKHSVNKSKQSKHIAEAEAEAEAEAQKPKRPPSALAAEGKAIASAWASSFGPASATKAGRLLLPLAARYPLPAILKAVAAYARKAQAEGKPQFYTPGRFMEVAAQYVLPCVPSNELTEAEARLVGGEILQWRLEPANANLLTERAKGQAPV